MTELAASVSVLPAPPKAIANGVPLIVPALKTEEPPLTISIPVGPEMVAPALLLMVPVSARIPNLSPVTVAPLLVFTVPLPMEMPAESTGEPVPLTVALIPTLTVTPVSTAVPEALDPALVPGAPPAWLLVVPVQVAVTLLPAAGVQPAQALSPANSARAEAMATDAARTDAARPRPEPPGKDDPHIDEIFKLKPRTVAAPDNSSGPGRFDQDSRGGTIERRRFGSGCVRMSCNCCLRATGGCEKMEFAPVWCTCRPINQLSTSGHGG